MGRYVPRSGWAEQKTSRESCCGKTAIHHTCHAAGEEPGEVARRYMQSTEFADDIRNFNVSDIVGVESTILIPSTSSPLK